MAKSVKEAVQTAEQRPLGSRKASKKEIKNIYRNGPRSKWDKQ